MYSQSTGRELSLFDGLDGFVADFLGIANYRHWSAVLGLNRAVPAEFDGSVFVTGLWFKVSENWDRCIATLDRPPSKENWRWFDPKTNISAHNNSPEVMLERAVIKAAIAEGRQDWSNQIPIASGLIAGPMGRRRAIDLVHQRTVGAYDFVELKIGSDNPLFAAVEILQYGLVWLLSRLNHDTLGYSEKTIIQAYDVRLSVLAPAVYYRNLDLAWLARGLSEGLRAVGEQNGVQLSFAFETLPQWFRWPGADSTTILAAFDSRVGR